GCLGDCTSGSCDAPPAGETQLACLHQAFSSVALAAGGGGYLAAWGAQAFRSLALGRRLAPGLGPADAIACRLSAQSAPPPPVTTCDDALPKASGDGGGWYVGFESFGFSPAPVSAVRGTVVDSDGTVHGQHTLTESAAFGQCRVSLSGPLGVTTEAPGQ